MSKTAMVSVIIGVIAIVIIVVVLQQLNHLKAQATSKPAERETAADDLY